MVEFGDEFIVQSNRISWLIWIQLLVMILIVILLYFGFAVFNSDLSITPTAAPPPTQLDKPSSSHNQTRPKVEDNRSRTDVGTSGMSIREDNEIQEESSLKGSMLSGSFHPCNYIGLVRRAFLKCLGLDSSYEHSTNNQRHDKQD